MHTLFSRITQPVRDFLFPPLCLACRERLSSVDDYLCAGCASLLTRVEPSDRTMTVLGERFAGSSVISSFFPLYYFEDDGVLRHVIHALKYEAMTKLGETCGEAIGAALLAEPDFDGADLILPVPLHARKERERGYNQSEYICTGIACVLKLPVVRGVVRRRKNTRTQTKLSAAERLDNVKDAFVVDDQPNRTIRDKTILLVDDVMTTGATMQSCAGALRTAGAARIVCASIGVAKLDAGRVQGGPLPLV